MDIGRDTITITLQISSSRIQRRGIDSRMHECQEDYTSNYNICSRDGLPFTTLDNSHLFHNQTSNGFRNPGGMEVNHSIESCQDDDNQQLEIMYWQVSVYTIRSAVKLTRRIATPRLNIAGLGSPRGLYKSYSQLKKGRERVDEYQLLREKKRLKLTSVTMNAIHMRKLNPPNTKLRAFFQYMVFGGEIAFFPKFWVSHLTVGDLGWGRWSTGDTPHPPEQCAHQFDE